MATHTISSGVFAGLNPEDLVGGVFSPGANHGTHLSASDLLTISYALRKALNHTDAFNTAATDMKELLNRLETLPTDISRVA